jgi:hypothetical protein
LLPQQQLLLLHGTPELLLLQRSPEHQLMHQHGSLCVPVLLVALLLHCCNRTTCKGVTV